MHIKEIICRKKVIIHVSMMYIYVYVCVSLYYINMYNYVSFKIAKLKSFQPLEMDLYLTPHCTYGNVTSAL